MSVASFQLAWVPGGPRSSILLLLLLLLLFQVTDPSHHHSAPDPTPPQPCTKLPVLPWLRSCKKTEKDSSVPRRWQRDMAQHGTGCSWSYWWEESR